MLRASDLLRGVAVDGEEHAALFDASFVALRFVLGYTQSHEGANQTADRAADSEASQTGHDRARCDERTDSGNRENADPGQQAQRSSDRSAGGNSGGGTFRRFRILLVREVP